MEIAIIITTPDYAGNNIKNNLLKDYPFQEIDEKYQNNSVYKFNENIKLYTTDERCVKCENIDNEINADLFIFPTTHRSAANTHSLSCHTQGNWGPNDLGGKERDLSIAPALIMKKMFQELRKYSEKLEEDITLECTHHGPELNKPTLFIEIGSDEPQWKREDLGKVISDVIMKTIESKIPEFETAIGIGGPHYCTNFNDLQENADIAIGHICPKYMLEKLDEEMIKQAISKTVPTPKIVILDWKGLGKEKQRIIKILEDLNLDIKRTKHFHKK